jgi:hypothetical protein
MSAAVQASAGAVRYFRSTLSELFFKFVGADCYVRCADGAWFTSHAKLEAMQVATVEITAAEAEV